MTLEEKYKKKLVDKIASYGNISTKGALRFHCGEKLGRGLNRDVYVLKHDESWVVKIQRTTNFDNILEYSIWEALKRVPKYSKWFAEVLTINETGFVLFQKRVEHRRWKDYPKKIPKFFTDLKLKNYGWIDGQFVCCDYPNVLLMLAGYITEDLKTAKWWSAEKKFKRPQRLKLKD